MKRWTDATAKNIICFARILNMRVTAKKNIAGISNNNKNPKKPKVTTTATTVADVLTCVVSRTLSSYGDKTFAAAGPRLWNSLPVQLCSPYINYGLFRRQLKGHLFRKAQTRCSVTSDMRHLRKTLTYLLTYILTTSLPVKIHNVDRNVC